MQDGTFTNGYLLTYEKKRLCYVVINILREKGLSNEAKYYLSLSHSWPILNYPTTRYDFEYFDPNWI